MTWKRMVRGTYKFVVMLVFILWFASYYYFGTSFKNGSSDPTEARTEPLQNHGKTVYVTRIEKRRIDGLQMAALIGGPLVLVVGALLHFRLGVRLFPPLATPILHQEALISSTRANSTVCTILGRGRWGTDPRTVKPIAPSGRPLRGPARSGPTSWQNCWRLVSTCSTPNRGYKRRALALRRRSTTSKNRFLG
jgi:hypothetical protein